METYVVRSNPSEQKLKHKLIAALVFAVPYFILRLSWHIFWPALDESKRGLFGFAIEYGLVALAFGLGMAFWPPRKANYKLLVDEESITGVTEYSGWMKWLIWRRTVRKGHVRTIFEIKQKKSSTVRGIGISDRGELSARMWGFVYVPKTLPEYDHLRQLAESWRTPE